LPKSKSSRRWLEEHARDIYVKKAAKAGYLARAAYKLLEIQEKDRILTRGMSVVDLGAAPGSWSQVASECVAESGMVFALDILPMKELPGVYFLQGDFTEAEVIEAFLALLQETLSQDKVDVVLSDMAPNLSGIKTVDQLSMVYLLELALEMAITILKPGGTFLAKAFHGKGYDTYLSTLRPYFNKVLIRKPNASRARSREVYLLAKGVKGGE